jgi:lipoic acid synthetase
LTKKENPDNTKTNSALRRPEWLKIKLGSGKNYSNVRQLLARQQLNTVCESARCPNIGECWSRRTAAFMILGNICTRSCRFCNVETGRPSEVDQAEPQRVAVAVKELNLLHAVVTSVTRDDLPDGGASMFAETIRKIKESNSVCTVEVLIPDFQGNPDDLDIVLQAEPDILNHNVETVERLQKEVRIQANYKRSLSVIKHAAEKGFVSKSGLMAGIGETKDEILQTLKDLHDNGCSIVTIGQYLPPTKQHYPMERFYHPDEFDELKDAALEMGFLHVESGPLVRSSYHADEQKNSSAAKQKAI